MGFEASLSIEGRGRYCLTFGLSMLEVLRRERGARRFGPTCGLRLEGGPERIGPVGQTIRSGAASWAKRRRSQGWPDERLTAIWISLLGTFHPKDY